MNKYLALILFFFCFATFSKTPPAPPVNPTGTANSVAYFNGSGALSSNANDRLNATNGWLVISTLGAGSTTGNVGATGGAALVVGNVAGASSILSTAFGTGQIVFGDSTGNAQVSTQGNGSIVGGYATGSAIIATEHDGSFSMGRADTSGQISANGVSTFAFGYSDGSSILGANGSGSVALGYASSSSTIATTTGKFGQLAGGYAPSSSSIESAGNGSFTWGYADSSSGSISASGDGAVAFGRSEFPILASGIGAMAIGDATNSFGITASGNGSLAGGYPVTAAIAATGNGAIVWGDGSSASGVNSLTVGLGNANTSYAAIVGGRYASTSGSTPGSWVSSDPALVIGNGTGTGARANAFTVLKNGAVTGASFAGQIYAADGGSSAPGVAFGSETNSGIYRVGSGEWGIAILGAQAMDFKKSSGGFGNIGQGGPASLSDSFIVLEQRQVDGLVLNHQMSNPSSVAQSGSQFEVVVDGGGSTCDFGIRSVNSVAPDAYAGGAGIFRCSGGSIPSVNIVADDMSSATVKIYAGGNGIANKAAQFNGTDNSTTIYGLMRLPVQGSGTTPTCSGGNNGAVAITHAYIMCVCNSSTWVKVADGSTSCTF